MPDPVKKLTEDPAERARLAQQFLELLLENGADETLLAWLKEQVPREGDTVALLELALESCTPESRFAGLREGLAAIATDGRKRLTEQKKFSDELFERDPTGATRRLFYQIKKNGALPEDWRTREGDVICALRWYQEFLDAWDALGRSGEAMDLDGMRANFIRVYEAIETHMDRLLTLPPADRDALLPEVEPLYRKLMARKEKNLGA